MALEMRKACQKCGAALTDASPARICSFECTYCVACAERMAGVCPSCGGELVARPTRRPRPGAAG